MLKVEAFEISSEQKPLNQSLQSFEQPYEEFAISYYKSSQANLGYWQKNQWSGVNSEQKQRRFEEEQIKVEDILYADKPNTPLQSAKPRPLYKNITNRPLDLGKTTQATYTGKIDEDINENIAILEQVLDDFKTPGKSNWDHQGPHGYKIRNSKAARNIMSKESPIKRTI